MCEGSGAETMGEKIRDAEPVFLGEPRTEAHVFFVPMVPHNASPPSPKTRELADLLTRTIQEYEKYHPNVSGAEVRTALQLAAQGSKRAVPDARLVMVAGTLAALLVGFLVVAMRGGDTAPGSPGMIAIAVAVFLIVGLVVLLVRNERGRGA